MTAPIHVLLVEDNEGDIALMREQLADSKLHVALSVVRDGAEAVDFLKRRGAYAEAHSPDMIMLDLNLPKLDGRQVLAEIKQDGELRRIPVIVLTSSDAERDIVSSYELGANCYVTKAMDLEVFQTVVQRIEDFWFTIVRLPPHE